MLLGEIGDLPDEKVYSDLESSGPEQEISFSGKFMVSEVKYEQFGP